MAVRFPYMRIYPGDILSHEDVICLSLPAFGAWMKTILIMWRAEESELTKSSVDAWGRAWGCHGDANPERVLNELRTVAEVEKHDDGSVTIYSKRVDEELDKLDKRRKSGRKRKQRWKKRQSEEENGNASVTRSERSENANGTPLDMTSEYESESDLSDEEGESVREGEEGIDFDDFWDAYGHKVDRGKCLRKWNALSAEDQRRALDFAPWYREHCEGHSWLKQRMPATFLNNENWNDQQLPDGSQVFRDDDGTVTGIEIKENNERTTGKLSARQFAGLTVEEKLKRAGYTPADYATDDG